jgi:NAD(P)-dependent dehydrogenase (short-subunit alcohol dehydrogenase family)
MIQAMNGSRVALVTDPGPIGRAIASLLWSQNWSVALLYPERAREHATVLEQELGSDRFMIQQYDPDAWGTLDSAVAAVTAAFGRAPSGAVLVFNDWLAGGPLYAGVAGDDRGLFRRTTTANYEAVYRALRAVLPGMVEARAGSVVVTGSMLGERPWLASGAATYAAAKAACVALVSTAAREVMEHGVRVNALVHAVVDEPWARLGAPQVDSATWVAPQSLAAVSAFLLSDEARDINGAAIPVYGRA